MEFFSRSFKMDSHQYNINLSCVWSNVVSIPLGRAIIDRSTAAKPVSGISKLKMEQYGTTNSPLSEKKASVLYSHHLLLSCEMPI
jgi:hypothetical protein